MRRRDFLASLGVHALHGAEARRPNIILIVADDLGYGDLGCYGQKQFATPEIDRLAREGTRFTQAYAGAAVCAPSRCCLMTGKHTGHARVRENHGVNGRVPLRPEDTTVAEILKRAGYRTGIVGKWGLGEAGTTGVPNQRGFDEFFGFLNQDHALEYYPTHLWNNQTEYFPPGNQGAKRKEYVQDLFTARALRFIRENAARPFFLYLAYTVPHASSELGRDTGDGFVVPDYEPYANRDWPRPERGFAAMIHRLDRDVGRIVSALDELQLRNDTLLLFTSDNGPALDGGHTPEFFGSSGGLRGRKGDLYEGGIRVPMIARWPGHVPANATSHAVWAFWDVMPTLAELAQAGVPSGIDGRSMRAVLTGGSQDPPAYLYWEVPQKRKFIQAMRMGQWKGVRKASTFELYNLDRDRAESSDVSDAHPDVVRRMQGMMREARVPSEDFPV